MEAGRDFNVWAGLDSFSVLCGVFCCLFFLLLLLNKNDKTQNILSMSFGGRLVLCFAPEMSLSSVDYLVNMLQDLFYTGLNTTEVTKGFFLC